MVSLYFDQNVHTLEPYLLDLQSILTFAKTKKADVLFTGDVNAHATLWGGNTNDKKGDELKIFLMNNDPKVLNYGDAPTWSNVRYQSNPDVTFCSGNIEQLGLDWHVVADLSSDHKLMRWELHDHVEAKYIRSEKNADWDTYRNELALENTDNLLPSQISLSSIDNAVNIFSGKTISTFKANCPKRKRKLQKANVTEWWTPELKLAKQQNVTACKEYKQDPSEIIIKKPSAL